ncbi:MAG: 16S rRNA (guanine(527)-N(7))-methyltransferase RsmG [Candidatus Krumholzibacteriota bacterium]|nr:16S rRNA (guanine(527)-N(7))-methyltransferase RsmG [Candidatus Krumholzibacteriota bacterium]
MRDIYRNISAALEKAGARHLPPGGERKLESYLEELYAWKDRIHLVGKSSWEETLAGQVIESVLMLEFAEKLLPSSGAPAGKRKTGQRVKVADIGAGPGFPGIVWKIFRPNLEITLFERKKKMALLLERIAGRLDLDGARVVGQDAADYDKREVFDLVVSKAAGKLDEILPLARILLKPGGLYITIKGQKWDRGTEKAEFPGMKILKTKRLEENRGILLGYERTDSN